MSAIIMATKSSEKESNRYNEIFSGVSGVRCKRAGWDLNPRPQAFFAYLGGLRPILARLPAQQINAEDLT